MPTDNNPANTTGTADEGHPSFRRIEGTNDVEITIGRRVFTVASAPSGRIILDVGANRSYEFEFEPVDAAPVSDLVAMAELLEKLTATDEDGNFLPETESFRDWFAARLGALVLAGKVKQAIEQASADELFSKGLTIDTRPDIGDFSRAQAEAIAEQVASSNDPAVVALRAQFMAALG